MSMKMFALAASLAVIGDCSTQPQLPDPLEAGWNGVPVCEKLNEDPYQRILRCSFPPAGGHDRHFNPLEVETVRYRNLATRAFMSSSFAPQNWLVPSPSARGQVEYNAMTIPGPGATQIVWP